MPDDYGKALLTDIGTEELAHVEMINTMLVQLTKDATLETRSSGSWWHTPNMASQSSQLMQTAFHLRLSISRFGDWHQSI